MPTHTTRNRCLTLLSALICAFSSTIDKPAKSYMLQCSIHENASSHQDQVRALSNQVQTSKISSSSSTPVFADGDNHNRRRQELRAALMQGVWQCVTKVTGSNAPGVVPGTIVQCQVQYVRANDGTLIERWTQDGWTPSTTSVVKLDTAVMTVDHNSIFASCGGQIWSAQSSDTMKLVAPDTILAEGLVTQFVNGKFVGRYKTSSVLRKAS